MMKPTKVTVSYTGTINLGNYENVKPLYEVEFELDDGDDVKTALSQAQELVKDAFISEYLEIRERRKG